MVLINKNFILQKDICRIFEISDKCVRRHLKMGLPFHLLSGYKIRFFIKEEVEQYLLENRRKKGKRENNIIQLCSFCLKCGKDFFYYRKRFISDKRKKDIESGILIPQELKREFCDVCNREFLDLCDKNRKYVPLSDEVKNKISNSMMGHSVSEETRQKISIRKKEYWKNKNK